MKQNFLIKLLYLDWMLTQLIKDIAIFQWMQELDKQQETSGYLVGQETLMI